VAITCHLVMTAGSSVMQLDHPVDLSVWAYRLGDSNSHQCSIFSPQGRHDTSMLGDMDHDSASLLPDTEGNEFDGDPPRQPNSKDAADTLTQFASHFALRHQGPSLNA